MNTPRNLVVVSAGTSDPSTTRLLADRIAQRTRSLAAQRDTPTTVHAIDLRPLATEITTALVSQLPGPKLQQAITTLAEADALIVSTPVYKAAPSALFTGFFQILDNDLLIAKPVLLAATAGTPRHALVVDDQLRSLFTYMRTITAPTSVFAAPEDWSDPTLNKRIDRAALELALLMESNLAAQIRNESWHNYPHDFGSAAGTELSIDLDSDLMRLAAGGSASAQD